MKKFLTNCLWNLCLASSKGYVWRRHVALTTSRKPFNTDAFWEFPAYLFFKPLVFFGVIDRDSVMNDPELDKEVEQYRESLKQKP